MNPLLQNLELPTEEITLESLRVEVDRIIQNATAISMESTGVASQGLTTRFTQFLSNNFKYLSLRLTKLKPSQHIYVKVNANDKIMAIPYADVMNTRIPAVEGTTASWATWIETLDIGIQDLDNIITGLLIPTRDAMAQLINRPEKLTNSFVTGLPRWQVAKARGVQDRFAKLTDPRIKSTDQLASDAFGRMGEIVETADKLNSQADKLIHSPRTRGAITEELIKLVTEISTMTDRLRDAFSQTNVELKPSADILALLAARLINCAEEVEWISVVVYRREQFAAAVRDTVDVLRAKKAA